MPTGVKIFQQLVKRRRADKFITSDGQLSFPAGRQPSDPALNGSRAVQQMAPLLQQRPPGNGKRGAMPATVKYLNTKITFQLLHGIGQGRSGAMQLLTSSAEAATPCNGIENLQGIN